MSKRPRLHKRDRPQPGENIGCVKLLADLAVAAQLRNVSGQLEFQDCFERLADEIFQFELLRRPARTLPVKLL